MKKQGNALAITSVSCETDFVTATDHFRNFSKCLLDLTLENKQNIESSNFDSVKFNSKAESVENMTINEGIRILVQKTHVNCKINFVEFIQLKEILGFYLHLSPTENLGVKAAYCVK